MSEESNPSSPIKKDEDEAEAAVGEEESEEDKSMETEEPDQNESKDEVKDEDKKSEDEVEDEEEEEADEKVGIYDKPLVLETGRKRERKKVERLSFQSQPQEEKKFEIAEGKGEKLGDMPFVEFKLNKYKVDELKPLHRILFRTRSGSHSEIKKHIRQFSGFPFGKSDDEYEKRQQTLKSKQYTMAMIKQMCEVLDVARGGTKDEVIERLLEFLLKPTDSGRKVPKPKRKRKSKGEKDQKSKKTKVKKEKKEKKKTEVVDSDDDEEEEDEEKEESEPEEDEEESEEEVPPPKKKRVSSPKKKVEKKKPEKKKAEKKKTPKKTEKKKKKPAVESDEEVSDIESSSDEDEPLVKQKKDGPPTNDELKDVVKRLLDSANLEEVTMKTVLKDVYAKYPNYDLSDRKEFIKTTVKKIIS